MRCPLCGGKTEVRQTLPNALRYRDCVNGHTFKTQEIIISKPRNKRTYVKLSEDKILAKQEAPTSRGIFSLSKLWFKKPDSGGTQ